MELCFKTVPQEKMRYASLGDYFLDDDGVHQIRVTSMKDWRYEFLVFMHECAEYFLCIHRKIPEPEIMAFDIQYEANRTEPASEPGNDPKAPYHKEHRFAEEVIEKPLAKALDVDWDVYESYCVQLCEDM